MHLAGVAATWAGCGQEVVEHSMVSLSASENALKTSDAAHTQCLPAPQAARPTSQRNQHQPHQPCFLNDRMRKVDSRSTYSDPSRQFKHPLYGDN